VFFVISGYVIHRQLGTLNRFSFREFYTKRAMRIFPSLLVVILMVTILGRYFFLDHSYHLLLNSVATSSIFATNYYFIGSSNYFDLDAVSKPLLPLWSLAVEEQFYLLWPLCFWGFLKFYKKVLPLFILASFLSALYFGSH
jgi:peptidoglycan/LPS O-acetylase OafA/YrhL